MDEILYKNGWISVADKLPEDGQICLTWIGEPAACKGGQEIQIGRFYSADDQPESFWGFSYHNGFLGGFEITYWMPLPEPPTLTQR